MQQRLRAAALAAGVTLVAPETVFLSADTSFGRDVVVEPFVVFGPGVTVEDNAVIRSFWHLDRAHLGKGALVGPVHGKPGRARVWREDMHMGKLVEVKAATVGGPRQGRWPRLYVGDARVGTASMWGPAPSCAIVTGRPAPHQTIRPERLDRLELGRWWRR